MARVPHWEFQRAYRACEVAAPRADALSPWDHFLALCFAQMTFRQSLRDIEACLRAQRGLAYHLGFRGAITRSALARANEQRDWRPWALLARKLMPKVRSLYQTEPAALDLDVPVIAVDTSLIDLSLALCPWANFTGVKAALKLHAALDLRGPVPAFVNVTSGKESNMGGLDYLPVEPGAVYVMDVDTWASAVSAASPTKAAFFVIRARPDVRFYVRASRPVDRGTSLRADQIVRLNGTDAPQHWPGDLRRVTLYDADHSRRLIFWSAPAAVVAEAYRQRWQIELFFRWLKHGLHIQTFYGTSDNAVRLQLWASICVYLAMATARKQLGITTNLTTFVQVLSLHALSKAPIPELFNEIDTSEAAHDLSNQLIFNDFK